MNRFIDTPKAKPQGCDLTWLKGIIHCNKNLRGTFAQHERPHLTIPIVDSHSSHQVVITIDLVLCSFVIRNPKTFERTASEIQGYPMFKIVIANLHRDLYRARLEV